jgi:hypothetical protein
VQLRSAIPGVMGIVHNKLDKNSDADQERLRRLDQDPVKVLGQ